MNQDRQHTFSQNAVNKFNLQQAKSRDIAERTNHSIEDHRAKNEERFYTRDEGLKKVKEERDQFLRKEDQRHKQKLQARDRIMRNISVEHAQKIEMRKLRVMDASSNLERERYKKQEFQDFQLKRELIKNAFNQEASQMAQSMITQHKLSTNFEEVEAVNQTRIAQTLKRKKPDQILLEIRNKKIQELNQYKEASSEQKYKDIQSLLTMMNQHAKLPKTASNVENPELAKAN